MSDQAYPVGHPAHPEYKGEPWVNPATIGQSAYPPHHPAYMGKNVHAIDTPDGHREFLNQRQNNLLDLAAVGALPPVVDTETGAKVDLSPEQLAHVYSMRNGIRNEALAAEITQRYGLNAQVKAADSQPARLSDDDVALGFVMGLGYSPERARAILDKYGVPDVVTEKLEHERK